MSITDNIFWAVKISLKKVVDLQKNLNKLQRRKYSGNNSRCGI